MKLILATVQPAILDDIQEALEPFGVNSMTVCQVLDLREQGMPERYRGQEFRRPATKLRLDIVVENVVARDAVAAIRKTGPATVLVINLEDLDAPSPFQAKRITKADAVWTLKTEMSEKRK